MKSKELIFGDQLHNEELFYIYRGNIFRKTLLSNACVVRLKKYFLDPW